MRLAGSRRSVRRARWFRSVGLRNRVRQGGEEEVLGQGVGRARVVGLVNPYENVNGIWLVVTAARI